MSTPNLDTLILNRRLPLLEDRRGLLSVRIGLEGVI